jgi:glycerate dehydrogenase
LPSYSQSVSDGKWSHSDFFCHFGDSFNDLEGKKIGIVGFGELGQSVARVADCFGMEVLIAKRGSGDTRAGRVDLPILLAASDVVTLHCPLTDDNRHMIGERELSSMKCDAILINTARGGLVDETALLSALENGQIAGAALDVLEEEPPSIDHALIKYQADNLIVTPHIAWASIESRQRLLDEIAANIEAFQRGEPRNLV